MGERLSESSTARWCWWGGGSSRLACDGKFPACLFRPNPIGLSVAEVISVSGGRLVLGGADIVDGSPVLDIKPYVPFCDGCPQAKAPPWVQV